MLDKSSLTPPSRIDPKIAFQLGFAVTGHDFEVLSYKFDYCLSG